MYIISNTLTRKDLVVNGDLRQLRDNVDKICLYLGGMEEYFAMLKNMIVMQNGTNFPLWYFLISYLTLKNRLKQTLHFISKLINNDH